MNTFSKLQGKTISKVEGLYPGSDNVTITTTDNCVFTMCHYQDCCEQVEVEDVTGEPEDIVNGFVTVAEERIQEGPAESYQSSTWTFYEIRTTKGDITIRWLGTSNGYSERVDVSLIEA